MPKGVYKRTEEHGKNLSKAEKGKHNSPKTEFKKGHIPWSKGKIGVYSKEHLDRMSEIHKGKKASKETREKMSKSQKGIHLGAKHPSWKGGIGKEPYGFNFDKILKEKIRKRDSYSCQNCRKSQKENGRKLAVHHINYIKKDCYPENLIAICDSCNSKANYNRESWQKYYEGVVSCQLQLIM